jgi:hypothetical protein
MTKNPSVYSANDIHASVISRADPEYNNFAAAMVFYGRVPGNEIGHGLFISDPKTE